MSTRSTACVFLDRDGVLNRDRANYTYQLTDFEILPGVPAALRALRDAQFLRVVITNQAGIAKGIYTRGQMGRCHEYLQMTTGHLINKFYYAPYHPSITESLTRKPDSLMLEKAIARFGVAVGQSWMIGDAERDLIPAQKLGLRTIRISETAIDTVGHFTAPSLYEAVKIILDQRRISLR